MSTYLYTISIKQKWLKFFEILIKAIKQNNNNNKSNLIIKELIKNI